MSETPSSETLLASAEEIKALREALGPLFPKHSVEMLISALQELSEVPEQVQPDVIDSMTWLCRSHGAHPDLSRVLVGLSKVLGTTGSPVAGRGTTSSQPSDGNPVIGPTKRASSDGDTAPCRPTAFPDAGPTADFICEQARNDAHLSAEDGLKRSSARQGSVVDERDGEPTPAAGGFGTVLSHIDVRSNGPRARAQAVNGSAGGPGIAHEGETSLDAGDVQQVAASLDPRDTVSSGSVERLPVQKGSTLPHEPQLAAPRLSPGAVAPPRAVGVDPPSVSAGVNGPTLSTSRVGDIPAIGEIGGVPSHTEPGPEDEAPAQAVNGSAGGPGIAREGETSLDAGGGQQVAAGLDPRETVSSGSVERPPVQEGSTLPREPTSAAPGLSPGATALPGSGSMDAAPGLPRDGHASSTVLVENGVGDTRRGEEAVDTATGNDDGDSARRTSNNRRRRRRRQVLVEGDDRGRISQWFIRAKNKVLNLGRKVSEDCRDALNTAATVARGIQHVFPPL